MLPIAIAYVLQLKFLGAWIVQRACHFLLRVPAIEPVLRGTLRAVHQRIARSSASGIYSVPIWIAGSLALPPQERPRWRSPLPGSVEPNR